MGPDDANLTWLVDTRKPFARWWKPLFKRYGLDIEKFPRIADTTEIVGKIKPDVAQEFGVNGDAVVVVGAGDLTAAAVGTGAVREGESHIYIGTSDWLGAHISRRKVDVSNYIGSILSGIPGRYLLVAEQEIAAGALEWAMNITNMKERYTDVEELVESSNPGSGNLIFLPWFYGERSPVDDPFVRGGFVNLKIDTGRGELFRSIMEGVAFNIKWALGPFEKIVGVHEGIRFAGGGALFESWGQILADVLNRRILRVKNPQNVTLLGSAIIASVALRTYETFEEATSRVKIDKIFAPRKESNAVYEELFSSFKQIYKNLKGVFKKLNSGKIRV